MPEENASRLEHARELGEDVSIVSRLGKESERREEVENGAEASGPARRKRPHVASRITEARSGAALARALQEIARVIESVDVESCFGEQVCVASLSAGDVEQARTGWKPEDVDESSDFMSVALEREQRLVFEQVLSVEVALPPFAPLRTLCHPIKISVRTCVILMAAQRPEDLLLWHVRLYGSKKAGPPLASLASG